MSGPEIADPLFRAAVVAIDAGDVPALERLLAARPQLLRDRLEGYGEGYFHRPHLLWFVAENPIRNGSLPANIGDVTRTILRAAGHEKVESLPEQLQYALGLVSSGRVPRESGVQLELIDRMVDAGARPGGALMPALAHREAAAVERLLELGAPLTLTAAVCTGRMDEAARLLATANPSERQAALSGAALFGLAPALRLLIAQGVDVNAFSPPDFHPHGTALHHAVDSGSLEAVRVLAEAGASLEIRDRIHDGTALDWAQYLDRTQIAEYLRETTIAR